MRVNATQNSAPNLLQPTVSGGKPSVSFQTVLDSATQNLDQSGRSVTVVKSYERQEPAQAITRPQTPAQELEEYLRKTPAQHMREAILKEMGLSEESLAALPPEQRAAIEKTITDKIKERLLNQSGNTKNQVQQPLPFASLSMQEKSGGGLKVT
ncbi:MAG: hypothetical protein WCK63_08195 [Betaproteobacteria bacterium]